MKVRVYLEDRIYDATPDVYEEEVYGNSAGNTISKGDSSEDDNLDVNDMLDIIK